MQIVHDHEHLREIAACKGWDYISRSYALSEDFIEEFAEHLNWYSLSIFQHLTSQVLRKFTDKVDWGWVSRYQNLSEATIAEFADKVDWYWIFISQRLSEGFVERFRREDSWQKIALYQELSESFRSRFGLVVPLTCWTYYTVDQKLQYIKGHGLDEVYEIDKDCLYACKSARSDGYSIFTFRYHYEVDNTYESHCDCNIDNDDSFGLSAWTEKGALAYHNTGKLFRVKINLNDLGCFVRSDNKIRTRKLTVIEEMRR